MCCRYTSRMSSLIEASAAGREKDEKRCLNILSAPEVGKRGDLSSCGKCRVDACTWCEWPYAGCLGTLPPLFIRYLCRADVLGLTPWAPSRYRKEGAMWVNHCRREAACMNF